MTMNESNLYQEPDFIDLCKRLLDTSQEFSAIANAIRTHPRYEPRVFVQYFSPVLLGYKSEIRKFFFDHYGAQHPVFEELTYDFIGFETLEVLPTLVTEMRGGTFPKLGFLALLKNPVLINEVFPKLKQLKLKYHSLQHWPESIRLATSLERLDMWGNYTKTLPADIGYLHNLKYLILANNSLEELPESIADLSELQELILCANNLAQLPNWISRLSKLLLLSVSNNNLDKIPDFIFSMEHLEILDWAANKLNEFPTNIGMHSQIKELDLSGNTISAIPNSIVDLVKLKLLNLKGNPMSEAQITDLRKKLPNCSVIF